MGGRQHCNELILLPRTTHGLPRARPTPNAGLAARLRGNTYGAAGMSWMDIAWPMMGAASLTLALVYFLLWIGQRREYPYLMFSLAASSVGALAILELLAMRTTSTAQYGELLRWANVFIAVLATALVGYVRLRFRAGSLWLAYAAIGLRWLSLIPNFFSGANLNFSSVHALTHVGFLGGTVAV